MCNCLRPIGPTTQFNVEEWEKRIVERFEKLPKPMTEEEIRANPFVLGGPTPPKPKELLVF